MSKVYEALIKAERERRWSEAVGSNPTDTPESPTPNGLAPEAFAPDSTTPEPRHPLPATEPHPAAAESKPIEPTMAALQPEHDRLFHHLWRRSRRPFSGRGPTLTVGREGFRAGNEQFQVMRANLQEWVAEHHKRLILITSALRGEGKSFVAINLAASLAKPDSPVLLVDADFREPSLHRALNLVPLRSLRDYLVGEATFSECLTPTPIPGLTLVAARGDNFPAAEAFAGPRMREFIASARDLTPPHYVLIDAPAAMAAPEAQILAGLVDAALLVVKANHTPRDMVIKSVDALKGTPVIGAVLNYFEPPYSAARHLKYYGSREADLDGASEMD